MNQLWNWILSLGPEGASFVALIGGVLLLFVLAIVFAFVTLLFRFRNHQRARRWTRLEKRWEPVLNEILAGEAEPDRIWNMVSRRDEEFVVNVLLRYAGRLRGDELERIKAVAKPYLESMLSHRMPGNPPRRAMAIRSVAVLGLPEFEAEVKAALEDPAPLVAMVAARGLAQTGEARHVGPILRHMDHFEVWSQNLLMNMLVSMGADAAPQLRDELANPANPPSIRTVVANALRRLKDIEAAAVADATLSETEDRELAAACLRLLSDLGGPEHLPKIRRYVRSPDPVVRMAAVGATASLGTASDVSLILERVQDDSPWVALSAARGLEKMGATAILLQLAAGDGPESELAREVLDL